MCARPLPLYKIRNLFINKFFQDSSKTQIDFSSTPNFNLNPFMPKISKPVFFTPCINFFSRKFWKLYCLSSADFQDFPGPTVLFQVFPVLENVKIKFQDSPGRIQTLLVAAF